MYLKERFLNYNSNPEDLVCSICKTSLFKTKYNKDIWYVSAGSCNLHSIKRELFCSSECMKVKVKSYETK